MAYQGRLLDAGNFVHSVSTSHGQPQVLAPPDAQRSIWKTSLSNFLYSEYAGASYMQEIRKAYYIT